VILASIRPDVHERFVRVVARGIERAEREEREHLAWLRNSGYRRGPVTVHLGPRRSRNAEEAESA